MKLPLEMGDAVGRVPLRMEHDRQVVQCGHGRNVAGQRNEIGFVIEVVAATGTGSAEVLADGGPAATAKGSQHSLAQRGCMLRCAGRGWG